MDKGEIHDRKTIEAGKTFIKEGEQAYHAYLIQSGKCRVYTERSGEKVELAILEAGAIVGEAALIMDEPRGASVEAMETTTVIPITRDEFELKLHKTESTIKGVLKLLSQRLNTQNANTIGAFEESRYIDEDAESIVKSFSKKMSEERREQFEEKILPHMNGLVKALKAFKNSDKKV